MIAQRSAKMKKINIDEELFSEFSLKHRYYVDKTLFIKKIFFEDAVYSSFN